MIIVLLTIVNIGKTVSRQSWPEHIPLIYIQCRFQNRKLIIGIYRNKCQRFMNMFPLIYTVNSKTCIKRSKILLIVMLIFQLTQVNGFQHPHTLVALKIVTLHRPRFKINPFYLNRCQRCIAYQFHILFIVKK